MAAEKSWCRLWAALARGGAPPPPPGMLAGIPWSRLSPAAPSGALQLSPRIHSKQTVSLMAMKLPKGRTHCLGSSLLASSSAGLTQGQDTQVGCARRPGACFSPRSSKPSSPTPIALPRRGAKQHVNKQLSVFFFGGGVLDLVLPWSFLVHGDFLGGGPHFSLSAVMPLGCLEGCHKTLRSDGICLP